MGKKEEHMDLKLIDKYCLSMNPLYDCMLLKATYTFRDLGENEMRDLEEFANVEDGKIERWLIVPDCTPIGTLAIATAHSFGLEAPSFYSSCMLEEKEQLEIFPRISDALLACGSIFDNPFDEDYHENLCAVIAVSPRYVPPLTLSMTIEPSLNYSDAQKKINEEVEDVKKNGVEIDGKKYTFDELPGSPFLLNEKTKDKDFDWSDELCPYIEVKDTLLKEGQKRPDFSKRFKGQRQLASLRKRQKGYPFCRKLLVNTYFEDTLAFSITLERPKSIQSLLDDGYLTLENYLESLSYVSRSLNPDCICKKGYNLFGFDEESYYTFIMMLHSGLQNDIVKEATSCGWTEPTMDLKKIFR